MLGYKDDELTARWTQYLSLIHIFRKPGLPILMVEFPDGRRVPYWNTFYQEVHGREYLEMCIRDS